MAKVQPLIIAKPTQLPEHGMLQTYLMQQNNPEQVRVVSMVMENAGFKVKKFFLYVARL